jgi:nucleotide-binding universal stress UspA family protein
MRALVGIDLRASGHEWLVDRAGLYAGRLGASLDLVYFHGGESEAATHRARLQELCERVPVANRGVPRLDPRPAEEGLVADSERYDLMVMGSREPPALERLLHGAMATRVLAHAKCSVLVPRGERAAAGAGPRLLVGVDVDGPAPANVLRWADKWAGWLAGTVHLAYAASAHRGDWLGVRDVYRAKLDALLEQHISEGHRGVTTVRRSEPEELLITMSQDFDIVLVGNRERVGLARFVLGSVAGGIVRRSACDVICLPTASGVDRPPAFGGASTVSGG